jgi:hypothetical protein
MPSDSSFCKYSKTVFFVRESSQTIALHKGSPDLRLQATVVSLWLVMPKRREDKRPERGERRTNDFDTLFGPASGLKLLDRSVDA